MDLTGGGGGEGGTCPDFGKVCVLAEPKGKSITWANFSVKKHEEPLTNSMTIIYFL